MPGHYIHGGLQVPAANNATMKAPDVLYEDATSCAVYQTIEDTQQQHEATLRSESHYKSQGARRNIYSNMSDDFAAPRVASLYEEPVKKSQVCPPISSSYYLSLHMFYVPYSQYAKEVQLATVSGESMCRHR